MTSLDTPEPIHCLDDLTALWRTLVGHEPHHGRSLWLIVHDAEGYPTKQIVSVEDLPLRPSVGEEQNLRRLVETMQSLSPEPNFVIALLARPGTARTAAFEQDWARLLTVAAGAAMTWPVCCATPHGVRPIEEKPPA